MNRGSYAIETMALVKSFDDKRVIDDLDLVVPVGGVVGLLGPNGAGKTTLVRMLATLARPDGGSVRVFGHDVIRAAGDVRRCIAVTGQFNSLDDELSVRENLTIQTRLAGFRGAAVRQRVGELIERFDLREFAHRPVKVLSGGQQRRCDVATSLVRDRPLLFLDEPTTGLDPQSRVHVWDEVRRVAANGTTVLLTTQYLDEADRLGDRIIVIDEGRLVADGSPAELKNAVGSDVLEVQVTDPTRLHETARLLGAVAGMPASVVPDRTAVHVRFSSTDEPGLTGALRSLLDADIGVSHFSIGRPSLDEVFFALTRQHSLPRSDSIEAEMV